MLTPVHKISIVNSFGVWFDITNIGDKANINLGVDSIKMNKTKYDYSQEAEITISSRYELNSVNKIGETNDYSFVNQLPTNDNVIFGDNGFDERYGHFDYEVGDMVYIQYGYNENAGDSPEGFFGFVSSIKVINNKKVVIKVQNHAYLLKKNLYNFSQKEITVQELYKLLVDDYNDTFSTIYSGIIDQVESAGNQLLAAYLDESGFIDNNLIVNVDYPMKNFRAENATAADILDLLEEKYFTKTNIFQFEGGKSYLLGGLLNLLVLQEEELPDDLSAYLNLKFVYKNYDLKYETFGLNDNYIEDKIRQQDSTLASDSSFFYDFILQKKLTWQNAKDVQVRVNFKVYNRGEQPVDVAYGDEGGEEKVVVYYEPKSAEELKEFSEDYIAEYKYTGYKKGSTLTGFGYPTANVFDAIYIVEVYQNQSSGDTSKEPYILIIQKYNVEGVMVDYGKSGIRQTITVGKLLSSNIKEATGIDQSVFKKRTDVYTDSLPSEGVVVQPEEFEDNSTDYQLLNQIDISLDLVDDSVSNILPNYNLWIQKTNELKDIVYREGTIGLEYAGGFYTKTNNGPQANFERVNVITNALAPNSTITQSETLRRELSNGNTLSITEAPVEDATGIYQRVVYYDNRAQKAFEFADKDIQEAESRGLDVTSRLNRYNQAKVDYTPIESRVRTVKNFDNETNNYN